MNLSDTITNKPLAGYIRGIEYYANKGNNMQPTDSTIVAPPIDVSCVVTFPLLGQEKLGAFLPLFHQRYPYNKYCFTANGERALVGCAPLAAGTIMAYYKWPKEYHNQTFDWDAMLSDRNHDSWARLFRLVGFAMQTQYGVNASGTDEFRFPLAIWDFGFKLPEIKLFTTNNAISELSNKKPLMVYVTDLDKSDPDKNEGHAWIVDGAMYTESTLTIENQPKRTYYFHCVWG